VHYDPQAQGDNQLIRHCGISFEKPFEVEPNGRADLQTATMPDALVQCKEGSFSGRGLRADIVSG
jgi:hypothetical protein